MRVFDISKEPGFHDAYPALQYPWTFSIELEGEELPILAYYPEMIFKTEEEAKEAAEIFYMDCNVFAVLKNVDFTEGRGPMLLHKIFSSYKDAINYIADQQGVFGSGQYKDITYGVTMHGKGYCIHSFNGYAIKIMDLE